MKLRPIVAPALLFSLESRSLLAQGCFQCRDNLNSTPVAVQMAYRHAIELLACAALTIFAAGFTMLWRYRPGTGGER